jgi:threonine dehydratase
VRARAGAGRRGAPHRRRARGWGRAHIRLGVEPEASPDTQRSVEAGQRVRVPIQRSIADGQLLDIPGEITFQVISSLVDEIVTVSDAEILAAMRLLFERAKVVAEPSGASAFAAVLAGRVQGDTIGVVLSGANVSAERFAALIKAAD